MKILYLAHRIPYPPNKGDKIRSFNEIKYLAERHDVDLLCLADEPDDLRYKADLEEYCPQVEVFPLNKRLAKGKGLFSLLYGQSISAGYFYLPAMQDVFDRWVSQQNYDAILCFSSPMAEYIFKSSCMPQPKPKLVMDFCDVDSDKWGQYAAEAKVPLRQLYWTEKKRLAAYERKIQNRFDRTVLISEAEAALFRRICADHLEKLSIIPNGVDHEYFTPDYQAQTTKPNEALSLVFTGAMDYHANVDGVLWFCREIWPQLKKQFSSLAFYIVGSKPTDEVKALADIDGVTVTGFVDDIRDYYAMADVCVVPLRMARGVQNKVLEAMAMGKAVVSTSKANAGIQAENGKHVEIADSAGSFSTSVVDLLTDSEKRQSLETAARDFVTNRYDWQSNLKKLEQSLV